MKNNRRRTISGTDDVGNERTLKKKKLQMFEFPKGGN
jgi:hypothetical protein